MFKCGDSSKYIIVLSDHFIVSFGLCKILFKKSLIKQCCDFVGIMSWVHLVFNKSDLASKPPAFVFLKNILFYKKLNIGLCWKTVSTELNKKNIEILEEKVKYTILYWLHVELRKSIRLIFVERKIYIFRKLTRNFRELKRNFRKLRRNFRELTHNFAN